MHRLASAALKILDVEIRNAQVMKARAEAKLNLTNAKRLDRRVMDYGLRASRIVEWTAERYGRPATPPACIVHFPKP